MIYRRTKIVCTLGPATSSENNIKALIKAGMDVARLNFSHGTQAEHKARLDIIRKASDEAGRYVAVIADLQGPKIRLGTFESNPIILERGKKFTITTKKIVGNKDRANSTYEELPKDVKRGDRIFLNDGLVRLEVDRVSGSEVHTRVIEGGEISDHKGINLQGVTLSTPGITSKDKNDLKFAIRAGVDMIALSFVRTVDDVIKAKKLIKQAGGDAMLIAKIEKHEAISNLDEIVAATDAVMVARGDLGIEMPLEEVPTLQKRIITMANGYHKPVITATQMLESMIENSRPTRAEVSDVANAIIDGTDAVMLSAETAAGKHPIEAVKTMAMIAEAIELSYGDKFAGVHAKESMPVSESVAEAACFLAESLGAKLIIAFTESGFTGRMISSFRPNCTIIGVTPTVSVARKMSLFNGVYPVVGDQVKTIDHMIEHAVEKARALGLLKKGDLAVITAGVPRAVIGSTNLIKVHIA